VKSELVKPTHLTRKAVVYIRQSMPHQVVSNQESLRLQYALRQRKGLCTNKIGRRRRANSLISLLKCWLRGPDLN
jgi:hypothetical protein